MSGTETQAQPADPLAEAVFLAGDAVDRTSAGGPYLVGSECRACGQKVFPPVAVCPNCLAEDIAPLRLSRRGTLYSFATVHAAPRGWKKPFVAGYVDLPEGVRVFAHITGCDPGRLAMDAPVEVRIDVLGADETGRPVASFSFAPVEPGR